jgi:hypothetical protein
MRNPTVALFVAALCSLAASSVFASSIEPSNRETAIRQLRIAYDNTAQARTQIVFIGPLKRAACNAINVAGALYESTLGLARDDNGAPSKDSKGNTITIPIYVNPSMNEAEKLCRPDLAGVKVETMMALHVEIIRLMDQKIVELEGR